MFPQQLNAKDGRAVTIRHAYHEDAAMTLQYRNEVCGQTEYLSFGPGESERTTYEQENRIAKFLQADNQLFLLAIVQNDLAGMIQFGTGKRLRTRHAGDFGMSVHSTYWGIGIGSILLQCVLDWAKAAAFIRKVNLRVRTDNVPAIRLYERKGFQIEGKITRDFKIGDTFFDSYCMGLELDTDANKA